jgi:hypothetical protein
LSVINLLQKSCFLHRFHQTCWRNCKKNIKNYDISVYRGSQFYCWRKPRENHQPVSLNPAHGGVFWSRTGTIMWWIASMYWLRRGIKRMSYICTIFLQYLDSMGLNVYIWPTLEKKTFENLERKLCRKYQCPSKISLDKQWMTKPCL